MPKESEAQRALRKLADIEKRLAKDCSHCKGWPTFTRRFYLEDGELDVKHAETRDLATWLAQDPVDTCPRCRRQRRNFGQQREYNLANNILGKNGEVGSSVGAMGVDYISASGSDAQRLLVERQVIEHAKPDAAFQARDEATTPRSGTACRSQNEETPTKWSASP